MAMPKGPKGPVKFTVIRDTREQTGWVFKNAGQCEGTVTKKLDTGDYSVLGYEDIFTIERKASTAELAANIVDPRFERELDRMDKFPLAFLVCEFTLAHLMRFPRASGIPRDKWDSLRVSSAYLLKRVNEIQVQHKTRIIFAGLFARDFCVSLFKRVVERGIASPGGTVG